ncbi:MAG TPA: glucose-1-phosphate adenylyltransferase [bacterium]|nr:glucose-1-phosphate adenylyltransferase [bacterium]
MARPRVLAIILAGGRGERLYPLTRERGKPAVPFGAKYRIVDFVLSNFVNSGIYALYVLVQYKAQSLIEHLRTAWRLGGLPDHFVIVVPPQMRWGESWYQGTADAVYQNINLLRDFRPDIVAIFGADHIYRMDVGQMIAFHHEHRADITVATLPVPIARARSFGVLAVDAESRIIRFDEKPEVPPPMPDDPSRAYASMGNYLFDRDVLLEALVEDARRSTDHDFGRTIIPELVPLRRVFSYNFLANEVPGVQPYEEQGYWRDVGTLQAYWLANMDLLGPEPALNLDNPAWPIGSAAYPGPSARFLEGEIRDSLIGEGTTIDGAVIRRSIVGRGARVLRGAVLDECIIMDRTTVGEEASLRRVIADRFNTIPRGARIGADPEDDRLRYHVDPTGLVILPRGQTR